MATIESRVYSALTGSTALMALIKGVYHTYPEKDAELPCISYYKIQELTKNQFGGTSYAEKVICIDIWSQSSATNNAIADKVTEILSSTMLKDVEADIPDKGLKHKNIKYNTFE